MKNRDGFLAMAVLLVAVLCAAAQEPGKPGPITPTPKREVKRIPMEKAPEAPPVAAEEIMRKASEKEAEFARAYAAYSFRQTVRVQEFAEEGGVAGEFQVTTEMRASGGHREERLAQQSASTLKHITLAAEDLQEVARLGVFWLTPEILSKYDARYVGQQQVDELSTYAFRVTPKRLERRVRSFEGLVWVDDQQFEIVKTFGRFVSEVSAGSEETTFNSFETLREGVDGKFRFPTYVRSEGEVKFREGSARLRLTMRAAEFQKTP